MASLPMPINPFEVKPQPGTLDANRLQMPSISKPEDFASIPMPAAPAPKPAAAAQPAGTQTLGLMAPAASGFAAGSQVQPTPSAPSAVMQTVGAGVAGAAAGATLGSVVPGVGTAVGAGVGGLIGLVSGGIQSFFGLKEARAQKRSQERQIAEVRRLQEEEKEYRRSQDAQTRKDSQENLTYNRRQAALASQWNAFQSTLSLLNKGMAEDENLKKIFLERGR